ncbi:hypothetical protein QE390_000714 [Siphonobacter sp. SORGH_AS 1065]|nr:hypothetical protein [Siphonobacter sp. SORGH_AS_1065]
MKSGSEINLQKFTHADIERNYHGQLWHKYVSIYLLNIR